ncbi:MAG: ABC transporter ATP-binding protein [Acidobacteria bacterium]|nr:ABC transporter ATP-binding protein [Acidobacteriota bacterium]
MNGTFSEIRIENFRRLAKIQLPLKGLNVVIGANGIGKTSLLDAFNLLAQSAGGTLNQALSEQGGLVSVLTIDRRPLLSFGLTMATAPPFEYSLEISPRGGGYVIDQEELSQQRRSVPPPFLHIRSAAADIRYFDVEQQHLTRPTWDHNPLETSLAQVPKLFEEPERFRRNLASSTYYHALDVGLRAPVRLPQRMQPASLPGRNGEDLVSCLYSLREGERDRFDAICDSLAAAFPGFERLDFPPAAAGILAMTWRDKRFSRPLYMHQLSEGTLRFLWLATLLQSPGLTAVTLIDEPEVSLHPELLSLLAGLLREASQRARPDTSLTL